MRNLTAAGIIAGALLLGACSGHNDPIGQTNTFAGNGNPGGSAPPTQPGAATALFNPATGQLPYPTDLYFAGSTDGTLNIQPPNQLWPNQASLNTLDGFSTTAVIRESFSTPLNPATFTPASVIIVPVVTDNTTKATIGVLGAPLTMGVDFKAALANDAGVGPTILEITPLHPLMPSTCINGGQFLGVNCKTGTGYLVFLNNAIMDASGNPAAPDTDYAAIKTALAASGPTCPAITDPTLNGICQLTGAHLQIAAALAAQIPALAPSLNPANIVLSFSFTTESTTDTLELLSAVTKPSTIKANPTPITTAQVNPALPGHANIYVGVLTIPYYLSKAAPLTGSWQAPPFPLDPTSTNVTRYNPLPVPTDPAMLIPVLITVPNAKSAGGGTPPAGGWPVLIFQHGITRNREDMFGVADSFADAGFVVAAIDIPLHGITNQMDPFYATAANPLYTGLGLPAAGSIERTFDLALINPPAIDPSGSHAINLASPLTERDGLREAAIDLVTFARTLPSLNLGPAGTINAAGIHYLGHSLGAIEGTVFLGIATPADVSTGSLANPGGMLSTILTTSPSFAPTVNAGLGAQGIQPGTTIYNQFFRDHQTVIDSGDPVNYVALATAQHPIHLLQVVGMSPAPGGCSPAAPLGCPDQVVPNATTQLLITASAYGPAGAAGTLTRIKAPTTAPPVPVLGPAGGFRAYVNFVNGDHGSIIDNVVHAVTAEMQGEAISFALSGGAEIVINVPPVIEP